MPNPKADTLHDTFPTVTLGAWWTQNGSAVVTGAHPGASFEPSVSFRNGEIDTTDLYDLTGSSVTLQWLQLNDLDGDVFFFVVSDPDSGPPNFSASLFYQPSLASAGGWAPGFTIPLTATIQGTGITLTSAQVFFPSPTATPKFWRIAADATGLQVHVAYSFDGVTYTILLTEAVGFTPDAVQAQISGGGGGGVASILIAYNPVALPLTADYSECFLAPDTPAVAWDLSSYSGTVSVPVPHAESDGVHLDGYWIAAFDNGGSQMKLMDPLGSTPDWLYDLRESSLTLGLAVLPDPLANSGNGYVLLELGSATPSSGPGATIVDFSYGGPGLTDILQCVVTIDTAGSPDVYTLFSAAGAGEQHWRLRLVGQTLYAETSTDPVTALSPTFASRGNLADVRLPVALDDHGVVLAANFGNAVFRYYNVNCPTASRARQWMVD